MDVAMAPMDYYFDAKDKIALNDPMYAEFKTGLNAIYASEPVIAPHVADVPQYSGLYKDERLRTMSM